MAEIRCCKPVLIVEGEGDRQALPRLIREIFFHHEICDVRIDPNPIMRQNVRKLCRNGELEKFLEYALRKECDSVLVILDADDKCPKKIASEFVARGG